jgi:NAD(P)-dependent dehydrogenase (short-subunit alcohol dehydrogenase family)
MASDGMIGGMNVNQLFDLSGRVAIVTGGGRGLGRQLATAVAEAGADVAVCSRSLESCEESAAAIEALGRRSLALRCDVRSEDEVNATVAQVVQEFGRVDILVNNAGTVWSDWPETTPLSGWQKVIDVNLTGPFLFARAAGIAMIQEGGGKIVNIASVAAFGGAPPEVMNAISYQASKGGLVSFTRDLACKWARHNIHVNAIAPGWFPSDMTESLLNAHEQRLVERVPLGRLGGEDDLKGAVVYLSSRASDWVTGTTLIVDGGQSAW